MMSKSAPKPEPLEINYPELNAQFYSEQPWNYFRQRLVHLAAVAANPGVPPFPDPITVGPLKIQSSAGTAETYPTPGQSFVAVEAEILLHHVAETLLRLTHAHAQRSPCPWLRMSSLRGAKQFKAWVETLVGRPDLPEVARQVFDTSEHHPEENNHEAEWIRLFGRHFLDSESYNAAKHGMSLAGGAQQRTLTVDGVQLENAKGAAVNWLAIWPREDPDRPPRWTRASRLFSTEAFMTLIYVATLLMEGIWVRGRAEHLEQPGTATDYVAIGPPQGIFESLGLRSHIYDEHYFPLAYEGEPRDMIVRFHPSPVQAKGTMAD